MGKNITEQVTYEKSGENPTNTTEKFPIDKIPNALIRALGIRRVIEQRVRVGLLHPQDVELAQHQLLQMTEPAEITLGRTVVDKAGVEAEIVPLVDHASPANLAEVWTDGEGDSITIPAKYGVDYWRGYAATAAQLYTPRPTGGQSVA